MGIVWYLKANVVYQLVGENTNESGFSLLNTSLIDTADTLVPAWY
jgi:hypothetical protein